MIGTILKLACLTSLVLMLPELAYCRNEINVGEDPLWRFQILSETITREGEKVRYQLSAVPNHNFTRGQSVITEVEVNCSSRRRVERESVRRYRDGEVMRRAGGDSGATSSLTQVKREIDTVCKPSDPLQPPSNALVPEPQSAERDRRAVIGTGSGFAVANGSLVVTNSHVVSSCGQVQILFQGELVPAKLRAQDRELDLALLGIEQKLPPLFLAPEISEVGQSISVLGYPLVGILSDDVKVTTGVISSLMNKERLFQISASVQPGNSGGPVLNETGSVVGVVVSKLAQRFGAENVNFAIKTSELRNFLANNRVDSESRAGTVMSTSQVVKLTAPSVVLIVCSK